jgi:hypothetical protein
MLNRPATPLLSYVDPFHSMAMVYWPQWGVCGVLLCTCHNFSACIPGKSICEWPSCAYHMCVCISSFL